jgi:hypothetical protein
MPLSSALRRIRIALILGALGAGWGRAADLPHRGEVLAVMRQATAFMVEKVSTKGGYVWQYLPDLSRRWGEMEAKPSMIWVQAPGTPEMGQLFLDAYHATGDECHYRAAEQVAAALMAGQLACGGWNYVHRFCRRKLVARLVRHHRPQRLAAGGISPLLRQRHLR